MNAFIREVEITAAYDKRSPDPRKNYGVHGVEMRFLLRGPEGTVQFLLYTNWMLPSVKPTDHKDHLFCKPIPADLGYHSLHPMYEGQESMQEECPYVGGKPCYYDGSGLNAERIYDVMIADGGEAMWKELEAYYTQTFSEES